MFRNRRTNFSLALADNLSLRVESDLDLLIDEYFREKEGSLFRIIQNFDIDKINGVIETMTRVIFEVEIE